MTAAAWVLDGSLVALGLLVAALSIHHASLFVNAVLFVAYGVLLSLIWLRLGASDVALTEAAVGAGLTGALLVATLARLERQGRTRRDGR